MSDAYTRHLNRAGGFLDGPDEPSEAAQAAVQEEWEAICAEGLIATEETPKEEAA
jgi:hypothetical protein